MTRQQMFFLIVFVLAFFIGLIAVSPDFKAYIPQDEYFGAE